MIGILLLIASGLLIVGQDRRGNEIGYVSLLVSLTVVNLILFYYDQFGNLALTLIEIALLFGLIQYRRKYLASSNSATNAKPDSQKAD
jgi:hypothetical protein